ncbi:hypothetical protein Tco_0063499, partial [Tanacetum coccineum]
HNTSEFVSQNVLLSSTFNEVNHLANITLHNPVMFSLDDKKMKPSSKQVTSLETMESDIERLENSGKVAVTKNGEY